MHFLVVLAGIRNESVCLFPVHADTDFRQQRHFEVRDTGHQARNFVFDPVDFILGHLKHQFVVHLHDHFGAAFFSVQYLLHFDHAEFDQVCRRALHGRVDGGALGTGAAWAVGGVDFGQVQAAAKDGFDVALGFGFDFGVVHVVLTPG